MTPDVSFLGRNPVLVMPSGRMISVSSTSSNVWPVTSSIMYPSSVNEMLEYTGLENGGNTGRACESPARFSVRIRYRYRYRYQGGRGGGDSRARVQVLLKPFTPHGG